MRRGSPTHPPSPSPPPPSPPRGGAPPPPLLVRLFREKGFQVEELPLFKREAYSGAQIRKTIYEGGEWAPLVPEEVGEYILEIDGPQRIRETFRYSPPYGARESEAG